MQMPAQTEVELDIFSGMPNPTWVLATAQAETLARRVAELPRTAASELSGKLGYRGLVVKITRGTKTRLVRVQSGSVHIVEGDTTIQARDEGRALERWLIGTGRPHIREDIIKIVERDVR
jgi:hypothetical protein